MNLLWAAGKLAGYGIGLGLEPTAQVLLHPSVIKRFTAHAPGLSGVGPPDAARQSAFPGAAGCPAPGPRGCPVAARAREGALQPGGDRGVPGSG